MVQFQIPLSSSERNPGEDSWSRRSVLQLHIRVKKKYWCLGRLAEKAVGRSLGDFGEPEDIAEAAAFLASAKARWVGVILSKSTLFLSFCFLFFPVLLSVCLFLSLCLFVFFVSLSFLSFSLFVCLSFFCLFVFLYFCLYGFLSFCPFLFCLSAFSSERHSDQMSEGFQVSKVTHSVEILKWHWITDSLTKVRYRAARAADKTKFYTMFQIHEWCNSRCQWRTTLSKHCAFCGTNTRLECNEGSFDLNSTLTGNYQQQMHDIWA